MSNSNDVDVSELDKYSIFYLIPLPRHDVLNKHETAALGTRQTVMQGYTPAIGVLFSAYIDKELYMDKADKDEHFTGIRLCRRMKMERQ